MKLIHLSDLHLGKRVNEFSMIEDQKYILNEILRIIDEEAPDGILLAGDLYDRPVPSAEAVQLFDRFLTRLAKRKLHVNLAVSYYDNERNEDGTADRNGRLHSMAMSLYDIMEMEGMLSLEMSHHIDEGVLVFEASYVFYVEKAQEDTGALMNKMNLEME